MAGGYGQEDCPVARALDVIGEKWSLLLLRDLFRKGPLRFQELEKGLGGVAPNPSTVAPADIVAGVGDFATALESLAPNDPRVVTAREFDELWPALEPRLARDAVILLKASRGVRLERLVPFLIAWANA